MIARAVGDRVRLALSCEDPEVYERLAAELIEAQAAYEAHRTDLSTFDLRPFADRVQAAEDEFEDALSETLDIARAEQVLRNLSKAITKAKIARGDYQYDAEVIPFPYGQTPRDAA